MSNIGDPGLNNSPTRSVEKDINASPTKGKGNELPKASNILEDTQRDTATEPKTNANDELSSSKISSPTNVSKPYSRSCSPAEENYETFRSPINDSRGYYANALRRRELGSVSPPRDRRAAPRRTQSPSYVPRSFQTTPSVGARHATPGLYNSREQDVMEVDEQSPRRVPPPRFPAYENSLSGSNSSEPAAPQARVIQRKSLGDRNQRSQSDSYVGVDEDMDQYADEDDEDAYGASEEYPSQSRNMRPHHYRESQDLRTYRSEETAEDQQVVLYSERGNNGHAPRSRARGLAEDGDEGGFRDRRVRQTPVLRHPAENEEGFGQRRESQGDFFRPLGEFLVDDEEPSLFISEQIPRRNPPTKQVGAGSGGRPRQLFSHDTLVSPISTPSSGPVSKKRKSMEQGGPRFNQPGLSLGPSRYSGDPSVGWGLNQDPPSVPQTSVSDAALLKRGLTRGAKEKVCKRGYGANDPENVNIVNMKEDGMSFGEIVEKLNDVRVANGRAPSLSVCGVTSRYNRTAPLLFAAEGRQFIPLSKRGKGEVLADGAVTEKPIWSDDLDLTLAQCVKDIDKEKWGRVAKEFNCRTGKNISAAAAALRHTLL
ncbi:hypothetical protein BKA61DRAFT_654462 [Leptodontidium sp. MPI-SDFR-AT-0119]|nr:hypothetical protein BKA61DRAFT_654462 [Leptodontidium sp. MPI-SDFR-AT-0119]